MGLTTYQGVCGFSVGYKGGEVLGLKGVEDIQVVFCLYT